MRHVHGHTHARARRAASHNAAPLPRQRPRGGLAPPRSLPHVSDFIKAHASGLKALTVRMLDGAHPRIKLTSPGAPSETVRIDAWKAKSIVEFLEDRLAKE